MGKFMGSARYSYFLIIIGFYWGIFYSERAHAVDLMEFLAIGFSAPGFQNNADPALKANPGFSVGGGISLAFQLAEQLEVETTLLYLPRNFSTVKESGNASGLRTDVSLAVLQYPVLVKYWLNERFALGIGAYYSTGIGNLTLTQNSRSQVVGYSDISLNAWELGLTPSVHYRWFLNSNMSVMTQAKALIGLTNLDLTEQGRQYTRDLQVWCGIGFKL
jgi:hypothetical protein